MIITRTPFRISFAGGGSDLPSFYRKNEGAVLSTTIDKYMFIAVHSFFDAKKIQLKYSRTELVSSFDDIQHPILHEVLKMYNISGVDINSIADIPSGTGLGSSSSFTVGLIHALNAYQGKFIAQEQLASLACRIEIEQLKEPIGKQDQYAAAYGGLNFITFYPDETVNVEKIIMSADKKRELENNLQMIYTGDVRSASTILQQQNQNISHLDKFSAQQQIVTLTYNLRDALNANNLDDFGRILHEGWILKKTLTDNISNSHVDTIYEQGIAAGASGGKLLGAGGGGFILFYCPKEKQEKFFEAMKAYRILSFKFDNFGSKIIYVGENDYHGF
jgi:D-glycero-alpha-D-manno-heptose-7-phosphate kinase